MLENVVINNKTELEKIKSKIAKDGASKLHILSDFDRTLTKAYVQSKRVPSIISILRNGDYLTQDYTEKANALSEKYHPIEINPRIPLNKKKKAMHEWWKTHFELLIKEKLNKRDIEKIASSGKIELRDNCQEFLEFLHKNKIPLVIMSSSGLGYESIAMYLTKYGVLYDNIHIISNEFVWDKNGYAVKVKEPIIHVMNKDETMIKDFSAFKFIKERKNVILFGDNIEDVGMITGFDYKNLIKIGFLNENVEENIPYYKKSYDVLILNDSSMSYVNDLLKDILKK